MHNIQTVWLHHRVWHGFAFRVLSNNWGYKQCAYLNTTSCQVGGCTWGDTCILGRSPCPRRCAGSLRCHGYKLLQLHATIRHEISATFEAVNCVCVTWQVCRVELASCCWARTDAASLVPGQLEPWTTLTGHAPFGCLFADVGAAMLLIHTVEALWDRKRARGTQWNSPTVTDRLHTKAHILRD